MVLDHRLDVDQTFYRRKPTWECRVRPLNEHLLNRFSRGAESWNDIVERAILPSSPNAQDFRRVMLAGQLVPAGQILRGAGYIGRILFNSYVMGTSGLSTMADVASQVTRWTKFGIGVGIDATPLIDPTDVQSLPALVRAVAESQHTLWRSGIKRTATMIVADCRASGFEKISDEISSSESLRHVNLAATVEGNANEIIAGSSTDRALNVLLAAAWRSGNPGFLFLENINRDRIFQHEYLTTCNACGEHFLAPDEGVPLASLNLPAFVVNGKFDEHSFEYCCRIGVRYLDRIVDASAFPCHNSQVLTKRRRRLGLGVMGLDTTLRMLHLPYDSEEAVEISRNLATKMRSFAFKESESLAKEHGPFSDFVQTNLSSPRRNASVLSIAPTGGISSLFGVSSGIEPAVAARVEKESCHISLMESSGRLTLPWKAPQQIGWRWHLAHLLEWQGQVDGGISKTITLPFGTTTAKMREILDSAWSGGAKSVSFFRSDSRPAGVRAL